MGTASLASPTVPELLLFKAVSTALQFPTIPVIQFVNGHNGGIDSFEDPS